MRRAQSAERVARAISQFAPHHNESDLTRTQSREGLLKHMLDFHKTMRTARKMNIENVKNNVLPRSQPLFCRGLQNTSKSAHTALAVKACLLGGKTATLNAQ